jgi:hypothetical protein
VKQKINQFLDVMSNFLAYRKGLLPIIGLSLIIMNWILQIFPGVGWLVESNSLLHLGLILAIIGFMLAWAL